jgi:hypothetical protein
MTPRITKVKPRGQVGVNEAWELTFASYTPGAILLRTTVVIEGGRDELAGCIHTAASIAAERFRLMLAFNDRDQPF